MANVIRNMNFKPIIEKVDYLRCAEPEPSATINMRVWDEIDVDRLRADAVKVTLHRFVQPEPESIFSIEVALSIEIVINTAEYDKLDDPITFFKDSAVGRVLASNVSAILSNLTTHSQLGPMITAPVVQLAQ